MTDSLIYRLSDNAVYNYAGADPVISLPVAIAIVKEFMNTAQAVGGAAILHAPTGNTVASDSREGSGLAAPANMGDASTRKDEDGDPKSALDTSPTKLSDITTVYENKINHGNISSDATVTNPDGDVWSNSRTCAQASEISVVDEEELLRLLEIACSCYIDRRAGAKAALDIVRPLFRTPEPVPVSLEKCARAVWNERRRDAKEINGIDLEEYDHPWGGKRIAEANNVLGEVKAVLAVAGVPYGD